MTKVLLLGVAAAVLAGGCGTSAQNIRAGAMPPGPAITAIQVDQASEDEGQHWVMGRDFVLLKVGVTNPETISVSGEIACRRKGSGGNRPVTRHFDVEPETFEEFIVPVDERESFSYVLRCRLQFSSDPMGHDQRISPWVEVSVPPRG
jgi:hypothetical protein